MLLLNQHQQLHTPPITLIKCELSREPIWKVRGHGYLVCVRGVGFWRQWDAGWLVWSSDPPLLSSPRASLKLPLVLEQYLFVLEGSWFILLKITGIVWVRSAFFCTFFPLIRGVRAQRKKPMPTTHFHVSASSAFSSLCVLSFTAEEIHCVWVEARERVTAFLLLHYLRSWRVCFSPPLSKFIQVKSKV